MCTGGTWYCSGTCTVNNIVKKLRVSIDNSGRICNQSCDC